MCWLQSVTIETLFPYSPSGQGVDMASALLLVLAADKLVVLRARTGAVVHEEVGWALLVITPSPCVLGSSPVRADSEAFVASTPPPRFPL